MTTLLDRMKAHHGLGESEPVGARFCLTGKQAVNDSQRLVTAVANTATVDLMEEVVVPGGAEVDEQGRPLYFEQARTIYLNHDYERPIGKLRNPALRGDNWVCSFYITDATETARDTYALIREGIINGVSIGFRSLDWGSPTAQEIAKYGPISSIVRKWLWLELSVTPMPCNPQAWITDAKSAGIAEDVAKEVNKMVLGGHISRKTAAALGVPEISVRTRKVVVF